ncbi:MAG: Rpn family recombination-promoting nuclease/putative transposase [Microcystaceae cyanobacterium]
MKIRQCYGCLYYAYRPDLVCAVHPRGVEGETCPDYEEDPEKVPQEVLNSFAKVGKFLATHYSRDFAIWLLGKPIEFQVLKPEDVSLEPIRTKNLLFLESDELILHIEFQLNPEPDIPFVMMDYYLRLYQYSPNKDAYQVVIYSVPSDSELVYQNAFSIPNTHHLYHTIRLWETPSEQFLSALGLFPLAVLSQGSKPRELHQQVIQKIMTLKNKEEQQELIQATTTLANLLL